MTTAIEEATKRLRDALGDALMNLPVDDDDIGRGYEQWKTEQLLAAVELLGPACATWLEAMRTSGSPKVQALMQKFVAAVDASPPEEIVGFDVLHQEIIEGDRVVIGTGAVFVVVEKRRRPDDEIMVVFPGGHRQRYPMRAVARLPRVDRPRPHQEREQEGNAS